MLVKKPRIRAVWLRLRLAMKNGHNEKAALLVISLIPFLRQYAGARTWDSWETKLGKRPAEGRLARLRSVHLESLG